jgi:two-component system LytT family sensor kinase
MKHPNGEKFYKPGALLIFIAWTLFGLFFASQSYLNQVYRGREASWSQSLLSWMPCAYSWALLTPAILYLARRLPFARRRWLRPLVSHSLLAVFFSLFALAVYVVLRKLLLWNDPQATSPVKAYENLAVAEFHAGILNYCAVVCINYALDYYRKYRERELAAAQLESQLAQAQLDALKKQLQPHFLFNTLNTVAILMEEDASAARDMLVQLSDLLRATLDGAKSHEVSLKQELEFIEGYLEIERMRFHDRLTVKMHIDPKTLNARVPDLILQPIVENAIRHGIAPRSEAGVIEIRAERLNGSLHLQVRDNGRGLQSEPNSAAQGGVGISNTQARLAQLYGANHRFEMLNGAEGGLCVNITIPFHTETLAPAKAVVSPQGLENHETLSQELNDEEDSRLDR